MKKEIANALLSIKAVFLRPDEPFTWASGIKSPIYCDNRLTLTAPEVRTLIENSIAETVKREYPDAEVLMGTSTAGIAHAAIAAHILGMPMGYVRGGAKDHGRQNRIEGKLEAGEKTVVIEDLISTGGRVIDVVHRQHIHLRHEERARSPRSRKCEKREPHRFRFRDRGCRRERIYKAGGRFKTPCLPRQSV